MLTLASALVDRHQRLFEKYRCGKKKKMPADQRASWMLTGATVAGVAALYVPCVQRTVPGGDSGWC